MKTVKKITALLLCLCAVLCLCACSSEPEGDDAKILGVWETTFDVSDELMQLTCGNEDSLKAYFDFEGISFVARFTFLEDGTMGYCFDRAGSEEAYDRFVTEFKEGMRKFCEDAYAEQYGSFDEFCTQMNTTPDTVLDAFLADLSPDDLFAVSEGRYKVEDGKILLSTDVKTEPAGGTYWVYTELTDTELCVSEGYTNGAKSDIDSFPMNFTKVG